MTPIKRGLDFDEIMANAVVISKLDAAIRQLNTAIDLFFNDGDIVSQHTLVAAAHEILFALSRKRGIKSIKDVSSLPAGIVADPEKFLANLRLPEHFFKHASRDAKRKLTFPPALTQLFLFDALRLLVLIDGGLSYRMRIFFLWFQIHYPEAFPYPPAVAETEKFAESMKDSAALKNLFAYMIRTEDVSEKN